MKLTDFPTSEEVVRTSFDGSGFTIPLNRVQRTSAADTGNDATEAQGLMRTNESSLSGLVMAEGPGVVKTHLKNADN
jgi:hypothetical protein